MGVFNRIGYLSLSTYEGITPGASHYYAELKIGKGDKNTHEVEQVLTTSEAKDLSDRHYSYKRGQSSSRFSSRKRAISWGKKLFLNIADTTQFPILTVDYGMCMPLQAMEIVWMEDSKLMKELNAIWRKTEKYYEKSRDPWDEPGFEKLIEQWQELATKYVDSLSQKGDEK